MSYIIFFQCPNRILQLVGSGWNEIENRIRPARWPRTRKTVLRNQIVQFLVSVYTFVFLKCILPYKYQRLITFAAANSEIDCLRDSDLFDCIIFIPQLLFVDLNSWDSVRKNSFSLVRAPSTEWLFFIFPGRKQMSTLCQTTKVALSSKSLTRSHLTPPPSTAIGVTTTTSLSQIGSRKWHLLNRFFLQFWCV